METPVRRTVESIETTKKLDPFALDQAWVEFVASNSVGDESWARNRLAEINSTISVEQLSTLEHARAAIRDIDFLISAISTSDTETLRNYPHIEQFLLSSANRFNVLPRGNVYTYAVYNPEDERMRTFTGTDEEAVFIGAVRNSGVALEEPILQLAKHLTDGNQDSLPESIESTGRALSVMKKSMREVIRDVSPDFFTGTLRPYFNPIVVGEREFMGPGGSQLQTSLLESLLHGTSGRNEIDDFFSEAQDYLEPQHKAALREFVDSGAPSLLDLWHRGQLDSESRAHTQDIVETLSRFRASHLHVANANFKLRGELDRGSGGYRPEILGQILVRTKASFEGNDE